MSRSLEFFIAPRFGRNARVLSHCLRDGGVQTAIQCLEFVGGNRDVMFDGKLGDGLADVAVVVNDLETVNPRASNPPLPLRAGADSARRLRPAGRF